MAAWESGIFKTLTTCLKIMEKLRDCNFHPGGRSFGRRPMLRAAHVFIADSSLPLQFTVWFLKIQQKSTFSKKQQKITFFRLNQQICVSERWEESNDYFGNPTKAPHESSAPHDLTMPYLRPALQGTTLNHPWLSVSPAKKTCNCGRKWGNSLN